MCKSVSKVYSKKIHDNDDQMITDDTMIIDVGLYMYIYM